MAQCAQSFHLVAITETCCTVFLLCQKISLQAVGTSVDTDTPCPVPLQCVFSLETILKDLWLSGIVLSLFWSICGLTRTNWLVERGNNQLCTEPDQTAIFGLHSRLGCYKSVQLGLALVQTSSGFWQH